MKRPRKKVYVSLPSSTFYRDDLMEIAGPRVEVFGARQNTKILLSPETHAKIQKIVAWSEDEVGWFGSATKDGHTYRIDDIYILDQEVTSGSTELTVDGIDGFVMDQLEKNTPEGDRIANSLRFWGHSHVRMEAFPSHQDHIQMEDFSKTGQPWYIRGIFNKFGDVHFSLYLFTEGIILHEVAWEVEYALADEATSALRKELETKVKKKAPPVITHHDGEDYDGEGGFEVREDFQHPYALRKPVPIPRIPFSFSGKPKNGKP